ncbi:hydroxymethylbilane synthase [Caulobacter sp. SLTY]|uniref:hydroxymethylbilane synthase n=1 Tax=Caulobacter sp. SLTY TaxID=2683262 RepID=UPI001411E830|nr:hydroxymethylbilane synthase [Caulobacter sp. SLTY]NBB17429.1 hydroxymethylbilane synthase [Caulobacter sp. SLTY]
MSPQPPVRIGTRASKLALAQSGMMQRRIAAALGGFDRPDEVAPLVRITTTGDRIQDRRLLEIGGKALFTKEIEEALLDGRIDAAVHSMKDVPAEMPPGLVIAAIPEREDPRDAFISKQWETISDLPQGARLGTASLRRAAQCLAVRPDLQIVMLRGNVDTRLAKLAAGEADAILLAASGLNRLQMGDVVRSFLDPLSAPPAPGQGALAIQTREEDADAPWLDAVRHRPTAIAVAAERGALEALEGSCRTAVGAHAVLEGAVLSLTVEALTPDGSARFRREAKITLPEDGAEAVARALGAEAGQAVRRDGGDRIVLHD